MQGHQSVAPGQPAPACCRCVCVEKCSMPMLAAFGGVCSIGGASVRVRSVVGDGVCAHECVSAGLARARCSVVQRARRAGDRVEERVCRNGTMGRGRGKIIYIRSTRYSTRNTDPSDGPHRTFVNILTDTSSHRTDDVCSVCTPAIVYGRAPEPELVLGRCD